MIANINRTQSTKIRILVDLILAVLEDKISNKYMFF